METYKNKLLTQYINDNQIYNTLMCMSEVDLEEKYNNAYRFDVDIEYYKDNMFVSISLISIVTEDIIPIKFYSQPTVSVLKSVI